MPEDSPMYIPRIGLGAGDLLSFIRIFPYSPILLILAGIVSCEKESAADANIREIAIGSANPVINYSAAGIDFGFCLLNEKGKPSTIFKEGENFSFYFSTINKRDESLSFDPDFICLTEPLLCRVYTIDGQDLGKPYRYNGATFISLDIYNFEYSNDTIVFQVPWVDDRIEWSWYSIAFKSTQQNYLPKGKYYTELTHEFRFYGVEERYYVVPVSFKINFEIK
jgi:hypothetical protein